MGFLYSQLFKSLPYPTGSYAGKTIIITGGNAGLGKEAARHYVRLGAGKLILAVRSLDKGHAAKHDIEASTGCDPKLIQVWLLDMASYASVKKFAARVNVELDRVDIFHANAGVARSTYGLAEDNEEQITVNVVSTFLLAGLVLPKLKATAADYKTRPTLVLTSSGTHGHTTVPQKSAPDGGIFNALNDKETAEKHWNDQYPISKLLIVLGVRSITEKHPAAKFPVTINVVDPGLCHSELGRDFPGWGFWLIKLVLARSTEYGSRPLLHAGSAGAISHGQYLEDSELSKPAPFVTSKEGKELQDRVWDELVKKLEVIEPGVTSNF